MTNRSVTINQLVIPVERVAALTPHQRYVYYLLGHVFNEMMTMQKLVGFAIPKHDDIRPVRRNAEIAQLFFLFRIAGSKIYEFKKTINRPEIFEALDELVYSSSPDSLLLLKEFNKAVAKAQWLGRMRNGMGFHYPTFQHWDSYTTPNEKWIDDIVYWGNENGNTFYDASATVAMHWMFDDYPGMEVPYSVRPLADELIGLIRMINNLTQDLVGTIVENLIPDGQATEAGKILGPEHDKVTLPCWTYMKHIKDRKMQS